MTAYIALLVVLDSSCGIVDTDNLEQNHIWEFDGCESK